MNLSELNPPQRDAVSHGEGPILVLAGAGTGKTRVITVRIAHLLETGISPWNILAVTFTNKAANEMKDRVHRLAGEKGLSVWVSTFHSFCAQFLRMEGSLMGLSRNFTIYDDEDQKRVVKDCLKELQIDEKKTSPGMVVNWISREKDRLMDAESFAISAACSPDPQKRSFAPIYSLYQSKLDRSMALDFGDLILKTVELLQDHASLKEKYQERFHHILVDEYQDTNRAQYVLIKTLAAKHKNLCVVGDDDQSIYSWRGADIRNILEFEQDYTAVKVIKLEQNYRSAQPILNAAWKLVQNNQLRKEKKLWTDRQSDKGVTSHWLDNESVEAEWIVDRISGLKEERGLAYSDFSIFYRTNAQSRVLEDAFRLRQVPYHLVGNVRFYERSEVKDLIAFLKVIVNPKDDVSLKRIINVPPRGIGKTTLEFIQRLASEKSIPLFDTLFEEALLCRLGNKTREQILQFRSLLRDLGVKSQTETVSAILTEVFKKTGLFDILSEESKDDLEAAGRLDNIQELLNAAEEFEEKSSDRSVSAYLERVSLMTELDDSNKKELGVTLMTVHLAKGLEFPVVFLTGLEEGLFPLGDSQFQQEDLEEERRLAYVGMTRAKDTLFLTCAASRKLFGQVHWNMPSRFIAEAGYPIQIGLKGTSRPLSVGEPEFEKVPSQAGPAFRIGERVHHSEFGKGKVIDRSGAGEDFKVVVQFDSGQWKKLLVKYAPLRRL
ncbi:MAG: UvrD-helicase domain-containing protein [Elusimicrobia bacterium]|nr:UvrD-helicase domain-containing protein [Elusimicrobiota bacterium]